MRRAALGGLITLGDQLGRLVRLRVNASKRNQ